jgi:hypothetical protein
MGRSIGSYQRRWNAYPLRRPMASSSMGSGLTYFARRASSGLRDWSRSAVIGHIRLDGRSIGVKIKNRKHSAMKRVADSFR